MKDFARIIAAILALCMTSCTFGRMLYYNMSEVTDYRIFASRTVAAPHTPWRFEQAPYPKPVYLAFDDKLLPLDELMAENDSLALLVIKGDKLIYEKYYNGHGPHALSMAFSMSKSFTSMLIGAAIADGYIESEQQAVTDFVPELRDVDKRWERVRLRHLLQMTGGMNYTEADHPFVVHPYFYWTEDMQSYLLRFQTKEPPGRRFEYKSGENQLLGLVLARALKDKTISAYMQARIWQPIGAENDALWCTDHDGGLEKTFCCFTATARDYAKLGRLYLHNGNWNGAQIIPEDWVYRSTMLDSRFGSEWYYQYQWWKFSENGGDFVAGGHLGQYIYVNRALDTIVVRVGTSRGKIDRLRWRKLLIEIAERFSRAPLSQPLE